VPNANIALGGSGANRNITLTPVAGQTGSATITVTVQDQGGKTASDTFLLTVQDYLISINDVSVNENAGSAVFTVSLDRAPVGSDVVTVSYATADNTAVSSSGGDYTAKSGKPDLQQRHRRFPDPFGHYLKRFIR